MSRGRYPRRIQLKGLDKADYQRYLEVWDPAELHARLEAFPYLDPVSLFDRDLPISLDVGCSTGEFLCALACRTPGELFLGLDSAYKPLVRSALRALEFGLENIRFIRADIRQAFGRIRSGTFKAVYLQFPLPGTPSRNYRPRIFDSKFVAEMHRALAPGGRLSVITDRASAFREMLDLVERVGGFGRVPESEYELQFEEGMRSHNYSIWTGRGHTPYRFEVRKLAGGGTGSSRTYGGNHGSAGC